MPNPPFGVDFTTQILPGFAGYAAARIAGRIAFKLLCRRSPRLAQMCGPLASASVTAGLYAYSHHMRPQYAESPMAHAAIVGASIATLQSAIQAVMPGLGWVVGDFHHNDVLVPDGAKLVAADAEVKRVNGQASPTGDDVDVGELLDNSDLLGPGDGETAEGLDDLASMQAGIFAH